ncbi:MAG: hypothetical protein ABJF88_01665 [Rhodothermales bacterium]
MYRLKVFLLCLGLLATPALLAACDGGISGDMNANQPPDTELAVRVSDLTDVLDEDQRFTSLVEVNWAGTDPDGFVEAFEIRFYDEAQTGTIGDAEGWARTTRRDSLVLLPIPPGSPIANVAFEVRAIDNEGLTDPTPARTVFPVRNSPPTLRISSAEAPPDTTWPAASFAFSADDLDGVINLAAIEVALNDTTAGFVRLPADVDFITLVAEDPGAAETEARLLLGRSGVPSEFSVPGLRTDAVNTIYLRAVDAAEFRSETAVYPNPDPDAGETWFVQRVTSPILLVNDYRKSRNYLVLPYHRRILDEYAGAGNYDEWYLAEPFQEGSTQVLAYSDNLPSNPDPTLRATLDFWDYIYWVSLNATNRAVGNNLPLVAGFLDDFFDRGGSLFVNVPVGLPSVPEDNLGNSALAVLPLAGLLDFGPGSEYEEYAQAMTLDPRAELSPADALPSGTTLPPLEATRAIPLFGYPVSAGARTLYTGELTGQLDEGNVNVPWPGPSALASLRGDSRVALLAVPLVRELNGGPYLVGTDGDADAPIEAVKLILDALDFPR